MFHVMSFWHADIVWLGEGSFIAPQHLMYVVIVPLQEQGSAFKKTRAACGFPTEFMAMFPSTLEHATDVDSEGSSFCKTWA